MGYSSDPQNDAHNECVVLGMQGLNQAQDEFNNEIVTGAFFERLIEENRGNVSAAKAQFVDENFDHNIDRDIIVVEVFYRYPDGTVMAAFDADGKPVQPIITDGKAPERFIALASRNPETRRLYPVAYACNPMNFVFFERNCEPKVTHTY